MILNLFLVVLDLHLHFVDGGNHHLHQIFASRNAHEVVLVFAVHQHFNGTLMLMILSEIDCHCDERDPFKIVKQFLSLGGDFGLMSFAQMPVAGGDSYLHENLPISEVSSA